MPDRRRHRGAHPEDARDFGVESWPRLQTATRELSWLLTQGYSDLASLKLVGDHHQLRERQRRAVQRAACSDQTLATRLARRLDPSELRGRSLGIDGFNLLITLEALLSGAPVFVGRDGVLRDLASVHGTYRDVEETTPALRALERLLDRLEVAEARIYLDRPVGNSGRLRGLIDTQLGSSRCRISAELHDSVDPVLVKDAAVVASSDSWILERAVHWVDLARLFASEQEGVWRVPLDA